MGKHRWKLIGYTTRKPGCSIVGKALAWNPPEKEVKRRAEKYLGDSFDLRYTKKGQARHGALLRDRPGIEIKGRRFFLVDYILTQDRRGWKTFCCWPIS